MDHRDERDGEPDRPRAAPTWALLVVPRIVGACAAIAVVTVFALQWRPYRAPLVAEVTERRVALPETPALAPTVPAPDVAPPPPTARERMHARAIARWIAAVARASGRSVGPTCVVEATLEGGDSITVRRVVVRCGADVVHDSDAAIDGPPTSRGVVVEEAAERDGAFRYALSVRDEGARSRALTRVAIDTVKGRGAVWSDAAPAFRVELTLPHQSEPVAGTPLLDAGAPVLRRKAVVRESSGAGPLAIGTACDLRVTPLEEQGRCIARLSCAGRLLYGSGAQGVAECTLGNGTITRVSDTGSTPNDGDPQIDVDTGAGRMVLSDEEGGKRWSATFALDPP